LVLPVTLSAAFLLIFFSVLCFGLWPNLFKLSGAKWRFELFAFDFAVGSLVLALIAAYTFGTMGSSLDFSDNMLVAGRRAEALAFLTGGAFALANLFFLGTIALLGLANATLLTASVFGGAVGLMNLDPGLYRNSAAGAALLLAAAAFAIASARARRDVPAAQVATVAAVDTSSKLNQPASGTIAGAPSKPGGYYGRSSRHAKKQVKPAMPASSKGIVAGILAGLAFAGVVPLLSLIQPPMLGIGAYGGMLLGTIGIFVFTFFLNFFFLNVSLEGGNIGYTAYFTGTIRNHSVGVLTGMVWAAGALALYVACTGTAGVNWFDSWISPFGGALLAALSGLIFFAKSTLSSGSKRNTLISLMLFFVGAAILLMGFRK
jgi:glucose uptake protein